MRFAQRTLIASLSLGVAIYALVAYSLLPIGANVHPQMREGFVAHPVAVYVHVFGAAVALLLGPVQFSRLRLAHPAWHRTLGRLYLLCGVAIGGAAGLYLSFFAVGGTAAKTGFGLLASLWLYTGWRAYICASRRRFLEHRRWMLRNFALAFAAVTLRLYLGAAVAMGAPFESASAVIAWAAWLPNLIAAEYRLRRPIRPDMDPHAG